MSERPRPVQGGAFLTVVLMALVLTTLVSVLLLFASRNALAQTSPNADYRFQNTKSSSVGSAPALTDIGPSANSFTTATVDGTSRKVLRFPQGNGLKLSPTTGVVSNNAYTIVALFEFDSVSGFKRIIDFKNGTSDRGLYVHDGKLEFFPHASSTAAPIAANRYVQVALTRNASGVVTGYVDGVQRFSFTDTSGDAVIDANNVLRFFRDNESGGAITEHSSGSVARIRLYSTVFDANAVGALDRIEPTVFTVNTTLDGGDKESKDGKCVASGTNKCTLRAAIEQANATDGRDTIKFASGVGGTIALSTGQLAIADDTDGQDLVINGPGARTLAVSGNNTSRVFQINSGAEALIRGLSITNGRAGTGAGIENQGTLSLDKSTVSASNADTQGGGIYNGGGGTLTVTNSTISGNKVESGGGIYNQSGGTLTLVNSTVSSNGATTFSGGGIYNNEAGKATLNNSTISANTAKSYAGGISDSEEDQGTFHLRNSVVAGNTGGDNPDASGKLDSQGNNLIGNTSGASGFVASDLKNVNPLLGPLQNNGGPTDTRALLPGSPAVDRGANTGCLAIDQRGVARIDGDKNGTVVCDIGAFERNDLSPPKVTSTTPTAGKTGVKRSANLTATFSEGMDRTTLSKSTFRLFRLSQNGSAIQVTNVSVSSTTDGLKATLNPFGTSSTLLAANTRYRATVTTEAKDRAGNHLDQNRTATGNQPKVWTFTTGSS